MNKKDARKASTKALHKRRLRVIQLFEAQTPVMQIVKRCGLSWYAVNKTIKLYTENGEPALKPKARGRKQGQDRVLSAEQEVNIRKLIRRRPWQLSINKSRFLWDRNLVIKLIEQKLTITLSIRGMGNYLKRWGYTHKNANKRPCERCHKDIKKWLDENYIAIKQRAMDEKAHIFWASKTRVPISDGLSAQWMITATNNQGKIRWIVINGSFNEAKQINFMKVLVKDVRKKVFLIREQLDLYKGESVLKWIQDNHEKIEVFPGPYDPAFVDLSTPQKVTTKSGIRIKSDDDTESLDYENLYNSDGYF